MKDWIAIFKTGTHTDSNGNTRTWTEEDLNKIAQYNPSQHEAPVVIGHPENNTPAYGWVEAVKREGDILYAKMKDLIPEFKDMVNKGLFKKRSISLYPDGTLRHVGWLGAAPPAVKGLPDFAFSAQAGIIIEFEEQDNKNKHSKSDQEVINEHLEGFKTKFKIGEQANTQRKEEGTMSFWERLKKRLADAGISFSELFGSETPPTLYTEADIQTKIHTGITDALKAKETEFSEKIASLDEQRKKKETELKAREDALKAQETEGKKKAVASFCEGLKKKGILIPAMEKLGMGITEFMSQIASIETTIEFGEGDKKVKQTPLEFMQAFLTALPKAIEFGEVAGRDKDAGAGNAGEKLSTLTKKKLEAKKDLSYNQAFTEVQTENPELAVEYAEELKG